MDNISNNSQKGYEVAIEPCRKSDLKTMKLTKDGRTVYIHSKYDPMKEAESLVEKLVIGIDSVFLVFGLGMGYHIKALLAKMVPENKIVVFEPNREIIDLFMNDEANGELLSDERLTVHEYMNMHEANMALKDFYATSNAYLNNSVFIFPPYKDLYTLECRDFAQCIKNNILSCIISRKTNEIFSDIWFKCMIGNFHFIRKSFSGKKMESLFKDVPAIIVSAGPSLQKNIELLKEIPEKALILSVDTSYKPLYNYQIEPSFLFSIDAQPIVMKKFADTDWATKDLVTHYLSSTEVQKWHIGRTVALSSFNHFLDECYKDLGIDLIKVNSGGSVACIAFATAYGMGADPIIFLGQDLAYTDDKSHIGGTAFFHDKDRQSGTMFEVPDINGNKVLTTHNLNEYRLWFQTFIHLFNDRTYIDATEGGALIDGTEIMTFREVIDKYCKENRNISETKEKIFAEENRTATKEQYEGFLDHFERSYKFLRDVLPEIEDAVSCCESMIKEINKHGFERPNKITKPYKKIKALNIKLEENEHYADLILPLMAIVREETSRTDYLVNSELTKEQILANDLKKYLEYYKFFIEKATYAIPLIESAVEAEKKDLEVWGYE